MILTILRATGQAFFIVTPCANGAVLTAVVTANRIVPGITTVWTEFVTF